MMMMMNMYLITSLVFSFSSSNCGEDNLGNCKSAVSKTRCCMLCQKYSFNIIQLLVYICCSLLLLTS